MIDTQHTPGPWTIERYTRMDKEITILEPRCMVDNDDVDPDEASANARLIAAAPDALEFALFYDEYMSEQFPDGLQKNYDNRTLHPKAAEAWGRCKTFITKATGAR